MEGSSAKKPEPTATYRLGVDTGGAGGKVPGRSLGGKIFLWSLRNVAAGKQRKITCSTGLDAPGDERENDVAGPEAMSTSALASGLMGQGQPV
jgi:hypothetical protein